MICHVLFQINLNYELFTVLFRELKQFICRLKMYFTYVTCLILQICMAWELDIRFVTPDSSHTFWSNKFRLCLATSDFLFHFLTLCMVRMQLRELHHVGFSGCFLVHFGPILVENLKLYFGLFHSVNFCWVNFTTVIVIIDTSSPPQWWLSNKYLKEL